MAAIFLSPFATSGFPGGVAGGFQRADSTTRSQTGLGVALGTKGYDVAGNEYTAVKAGASIPVNSAVVFNAGLADVRASSATQQGILGLADTAFASGDFGWLLTRGTGVGKVPGAQAINSLLVSSATAGTFTLAAATDFATRGAVQISAEASGLATVALL